MLRGGGAINLVGAVVRHGAGELPPPGEDLKAKSFTFEEAQALHARRRRTEAKAELTRLLQRLNVEPRAIGTGTLSELLLRYCMEYPLNIQWYMRRLTEVRKANNRSRNIALGVSLVALLLTASIPALHAGEGSSSDSVLLAAQVSLLLGLLFGILKVTAAATDTKAQEGLFWKASSDLKEGLYTFIETWRDRVVPEDAAMMTEFQAAICKELKVARQIVRDERAEFFKTFKSASEILTVTGSALEVLRGAQKEVLTAQSAVDPKKSEEAQRLTLLQRGVLEAEAALKAAKTLRDSLRAADGLGSKKNDQLEQAELAVLKASSEKEKAVQLLDATTRLS